MEKNIKINWKGNMAFGFEEEGFNYTFDAAPEVGGENKGPRPKVFMMYALAGCTGMDVVSILKKMRVEIEDLDISVNGNITEEHPKQFDRMHVVFTFTGKDLPMEKLKKAVSLSEEKYCGVSAVYKKVMPITTEIVVIEK
jgi:putative redox protein